jgi:4,5-dihydroxyphthalate decarboxylase
MPDLKLTLACLDYDRTRPLIDGRVKPEGIDLDVEVLRPRQAFQRMLDNKEFEVSELSLASYAALKGRGECPFVAVPVALSKIFRHSCIYVRAGAGIDRPQDLKGKRVGTSQWSSTGLVFMRGMLQHDYGVKPQDMHWFMGGLNSFVEPPLIALNLGNDIRLDFLSAGQTLEQMFEAGELDALLSLYIPKLFLARSATIARLFPNYKDVERDYYRRTRILPIMHTVVLRETSIARTRGRRAAPIPSPSSIAIDASPSTGSISRIGPKASRSRRTARRSTWWRIRRPSSTSSMRAAIACAPR